MARAIQISVHLKLEFKQFEMVCAGEKHLAGDIL